MRGRLTRLGLRYQLWMLFGLFLLTGASVLVIDEIAQHRARQSLLTLQDNSLVRLRAIKAVADGYSSGVVDTTFKVRNYLMTWGAGVATLDAARQRIDHNWRVLQQMPRSAQQQALFEETAQARVRADAAATRLREVLLSRDIGAIGRFADTRLYPAIDPVSTRLQRMSDLAMVEADRMVRADIARGWRVSALRIGLSLLTLLVVAILGRTILRKVYRGVEGLTRLAQQMQRRDYTAQPGYHPPGELGEVMDVFLRMRSEVLGYENELTEQLTRNELTRATLERRDLFQRSLLDAAQTAILAVDDAGRWSVFNPFAERLLGWRADEMLGRVVRYGQTVREDDGPMLVPAQQVEDTVARLSAKLGCEIPSDWRALYALAEMRQPPAEAQLLHKDGRKVPVLLAMSAFQDEHGARAGLIIVAADLTGIKQLERAVRDSEARAHEANHAKSAFLAAMSHEIRTPMIGVTGMLEVLAHTPLDADQRRAINVIQSSAQSLLHIIGDILDFSKIEAGRLELAPVAVALPQLMRNVVDNHSGSASSKGLNLTCEVDERIAPAHLADALRLRQIIGNFLSNAIKFTEAGLVHAALEWQGRDPEDADVDRLCFRVTDTGIGISAEQQARLFQPFAQAEGDTTRRFGGSGLGLAISRRLGELMHGQVSMDSTPGLGTTLRLRVTLPRARIEDVVSEPNATGTASGYVPRPLPTVDAAIADRSLVLLVDDHPTNRMVIARQLALAGYASEAAEDGQAGLERWRSGRYALVLSDVHMPQLDGYQFARAIREAEAAAGMTRTPIVALTAAALKGEAERCLAAGMDDYLAKPVSIAVLAGCLQRWLPHTAPSSDVVAIQPQPLLRIEHPHELDSAVLDDLTGGVASQARALMDDYLAATDEDLAALQVAIADADAVEAGRQAHKIKGAARIVGAIELAEIAAVLESAARIQEWSTIVPLAADLAAAARRLREVVAERYRH